MSSVVLATSAVLFGYAFWTFVCVLSWNPPER